MAHDFVESFLLKRYVRVLLPVEPQIRLTQSEQVKVVNQKGAHQNVELLQPEEQSQEETAGWILNCPHDARHRLPLPIVGEEQQARDQDYDATQKGCVIGWHSQRDRHEFYIPEIRQEPSCTKLEVEESRKGCSTDRASSWAPALTMQVVVVNIIHAKPPMYCGESI